jgi:uncharacterized protein (TIGR03085 family)
MTTHDSLAQSERAALCDLFAQVGPDAPTLCEGWTTRDLAAHLVVRERRPDAAIGIVVKPFAAHGDRVRDKVAAKPWDELVGLVRSGPPVTSPMRIGAIDRAANTSEFFIHHEDVRRAQPDWAPRNLDADTEAELWKVLGRTAKLAVRKVPVGVTLVTPSGDRLVARNRQPMVEVAGPASELVLFLSGRGDHARVEFSGDDDAVAKLRATPLGF